MNSDPRAALLQFARLKVGLEDPEAETTLNGSGLHVRAVGVTGESTTCARAAAGETFLQPLSGQLVAGGGGSQRIRISGPLRAPLHECRFDVMNNERDGDLKTGSFDEIILPHLDAAHNFARWLVRGSDDAEDVVQEACLRALRYFGTFRGGNARAWLLSIVRTTVFRRSHLDRAQQLATEFDEEIHSDGDAALNPELLLFQRLDSQRVDQAMNHLPARFREVLVLRELEGLSYKEIAAVVGVPIGTVMSTLSRARERFRNVARDPTSRQAVNRRLCASPTP